MIVRVIGMKKIIIILLFVLMVFSVSANEKIGLRSMRYIESVSAGDYTPIFVSLKNLDNHRLDDVQIRILSPEIPVFASSRVVDLGVRDTLSIAIPLEIPSYIEPGDYYIMLVVNDDDGILRRYYRIISVR